MIFLRILSKSEIKAEEIAYLLLRKKLAIDLNIKRNIERLQLQQKKLISTKVTLLTCKTKALLFPVIDEELRKLYTDAMPEVYAMPIVYMDWEQSQSLISSVKSV